MGKPPERDTLGESNMIKSIPVWPTPDNLMVLPIERADQSVDPQRLFRLLILSQGKLIAELDGTPLELNAPCALCLHEKRRFICLRLIHSEGCVILFRPSFLNRSFTLETLRHPRFQSLAEKHAFFQLQPFLSDDLGCNRISVSEDLMRLLTQCAARCSYEITNRADWYWSCRTRSYFMDIIRVLENLYYEYGMQSPEMQQQHRPRQEREELQRILEFIEIHLDGDLTLEEICLHFRTYKKQVERWFHAYKGMTYYQYVKELRLKKVCFYLRFTELQMKEIAARVGFSSAQNLARFFYREKRISMSDFRRQSVLERKNDRELQSARQGDSA